MDSRQNKVNLNTLFCVVIATDKEFIGIRDLINSFKLYLKNSKSGIIILDNSGNASIHNKLKAYQNKIENCFILKNMNRLPLRGSSQCATPALYHSLSKCMIFALHNFNFLSFLKLDPDSLITGFGLSEDMNNYFKRFPKAGLLGSYKYDCNNKPRSFSYWAQVLLKENNIWNRFLTKLEKSDYILGEHVLGGAEAYSYNCLKTLSCKNMLDNPIINTSSITEDIIFSTLVRYIGFEIHSFVDKGYPFALSWKGLPMSVFSIRKKRKKVIHSVKYGFKSKIIRNYFRFYRILDGICAG